MNLNTGSQNMHPITLTHYEHQVAPRLEQDIHKLYLSICFKRGGEYDAQFWRTHFSSTFRLVTDLPDAYNRMWILDKLFQNVLPREPTRAKCGWFKPHS